MKYAFIVLIVLYLIIYGCSPDAPEKKATETHEKAAPTVVEKPQQHEMVAVPEHQEEPVETVKETTVVEEPAPAAEPVEQARTEDRQPAGQDASEVVVMPCGRTVALADMPQDAPCFTPQYQEGEAVAEPMDGDQALVAAMQQMMAKTSEMVLATRELAITTQQILEASKEATEENEAAEPAVDDQGSSVIMEKDFVGKMQDVVDAATEVIEATNRAITATLDKKQQ